MFCRLRVFWFLLYNDKHLLLAIESNLMMYTKSLALGLLSSCFVFCSSPAFALEWVSTQIKVFKVEKGKETLIFAPQIKTKLNEEGVIQIDGEEISKLAVKVLVKKDAAKTYHFISQISLADQEGSFEIDNLERLATNANVILKTDEGLFKINLVASSEESQ